MGFLSFSPSKDVKTYSVKKKSINEDLLDITLETEGLLPGQTPLRITDEKMRKWSTIQGIPIDVNAKKIPGRENFFYVSPEKVNDVINRQWENYLKSPQKYGIKTLEDAIRKFTPDRPYPKLKRLQERGYDVRRPISDFSPKQIAEMAPLKGFSKFSPSLALKMAGEAGVSAAAGTVGIYPGATKGAVDLMSQLERPIAGLRSVAAKKGFKKGFLQPEKFPTGSFGKSFVERGMDPTIAGALGSAIDIGYYFGAPEAATRVISAGKIGVLEGVIKNLNKIQEAKGAKIITSDMMPDSLKRMIAKNNDMISLIKAYFKTKNIKINFGSKKGFALLPGKSAETTPAIIKSPTQPRAGGLPANISKLSPSEIANLKNLKPDIFKLTRLDRDVTVQLGDKTKHYKKGEEIYIYQDSSTGRAIVKDGDYGVLPNKEVKKVEAAGREIKEFAPELSQVEEVVKGGEYKEDKTLLNKIRQLEREGNADEAQLLYDKMEEETQTKFSQYQLPGGENYREVLIKVPHQVSRLKKSDAVKDLMVQGLTQGEAMDEVQFNGPEYTKWVEKNIKMPFKSSHWDEPNVLAHLRMNDRTTPDNKKVLFIEELQSDWARAVREEEKNYRVIPKNTPDVQREPFHPLLKSWQELALKRAIKEAVDKGYDYISWTTGEQQAERYDLSKQVDSIKSYKNSDNTYSIIGIKDGVERISKANISQQELPNIVGKDLSEKIIKGEGKDIGTKIAKQLGRQDREFITKDLKIGGEWAKNLYDRQVPNILKDLTKGEIENVDVGTFDKSESKLPWLVLDENGEVYDGFRTRRDAEEAAKDYGEATVVREAEFNKGKKLPQLALKITPEIRRLVSAQPIAGGSVPPPAEEAAEPPPDKIRKFITTVKEAEKTVPEVAEAVMSRYTPITNQATLTEAQLLIAKDPNEAYALAMSSERPTPLSNAVAVSLIDMAQQQGRWEEAKAIVEKTAERNTSLGQTIQALAMYERLSPEGVLRYAESVFRKASEEMADKILKFQRLSGGMSEKEKARLAKEMKIPYLSEEVMQDLYDRAVKISQMPPGRAKQIETALLLKRISKEIPKNIWTKVSLIQTMMQLLNPKTVVRNLLGNGGFWVAENLSETVGTAIDSALSFITGERTQYLPNIPTQLRGIRDGWRNGLEEALLGIDLGKNIGDKLTLPQNSVFDGGVLEALEKTLSVVLRAPDKAFYTSAFNDSLRNQMKIAGVEEPTFEMIESAHLDGLYKTFNDDSALSSVFVYIKKALNELVPSMGGRWGLGDMILKYPKTPANIISRGLEYSVGGFCGAVYELAKAATGKGFDQAKFVKDSSRTIVGGSLLVGIGALLGSLGIMTGRKEEDKETADILRYVGLGSYRINISALKRFAASGMNPSVAALRPGDITVTYDWFLPNSINLAIGANLAQHEEKNIATAVLEASDALVNQPLVQGLKRLTSGENILASIGAIGKDIPASFVPTLLNQVKQLTDNISRNTRDPNYFREAYNKVAYKVPILSKTLPPYIGPFGENSEIYPGSTNNPFNVFLNPAFVSKYGPPDEAILVLDIWKETGETIQMPRKVPRSIKIEGKAIILTPEQSRQFQSYIGSKTGVLFNILYHDSLFMSQPADTRAKRLQGFLTDIYTAAKIEILGYKPKSTSTNVIGVLRDLSGWWKRDAYRREKLSNPRRGFLKFAP